MGVKPCPTRPSACSRRRMLPCRMLQLTFVLLRGVLAGFRSRRDVALENLVLRHQLHVALRTNPTPRLGKHGSRSLGLVPAALAFLARPRRNRHARDRYPLAPEGLAPLLELVVTDAARTPSPERRGPRSHRLWGVKTRVRSDSTGRPTLGIMRERSRDAGHGSRLPVGARRFALAAPGSLRARRGSSPAPRRR